MLIPFKRFLFLGIFIAASSLRSHASPANSRLLPLVPAETNIVAGVEDPQNPNTNGHHLLVTIANSIELDDWLALTGADNHRAVDQLVWLAASSPRGTLKEHALLVAGHFDRDHIFRAAKQNGSSSIHYDGVEALVVAPFARELPAMSDTRWLAILDNQSAIFGTPWLVQRAIDRYVAHSPADPQLMRRIAALNPEANSWNVLVLPADPAAKQAAIGQLSSPWSELLASADEVSIGFRYGATAHIDFSILMSPARQSGLAQPGDNVPRLVKAGWLDSARSRVENLTVVSGRVQGSLAVPRKQFDACFRSHASAPSPSLTAQAK